MTNWPASHGAIHSARLMCTNAIPPCRVEPMPKMSSPTTIAHNSFQVYSNPPQ